MTRRSALGDPEAPHRRDRPPLSAGRAVPLSSTMFAALCVAACGGGDALRARVERADSAGVEIVMNRGADSPLGWSFEPLYAIGGGAADAEVVARIDRGGVAADGLGRLYVLDRSNMHVAVFDGAGEPVRTMGGEGGGPGEFSYPYYLAVAAGEVAVLDAGHRAVIRFDTAGAPLERVRVEKPNLRDGFAPVAGGFVFKWLDYRGAGSPSWERLTTVDSAGYTAIAELPRQRPAPVPLESCGGIRVPGGVIFAPTIVWHGAGGRLAVSAAPEYVIDIYRGRERVRSVRRDLPVREMSRADALEVYAEGWTIRIGGRACTVPAEEVVDARGFAPELQTVARIRLSPTGELWVQRRTLEYGRGPIDVFGAGGEYRGTLPTGTPFPEAFAGAGRIAAIATDEFDVDRLVVYRVDRM